jgi:hypothetical protein
MKKYEKPIYYIEDYTQIAKSALDSLLHKNLLIINKIGGEIKFTAEKVLPFAGLRLLFVLAMIKLYQMSGN